MKLILKYFLSGDISVLGGRLTFSLGRHIFLVGHLRLESSRIWVNTVIDHLKTMGCVLSDKTYIPLRISFLC